jgi:hypothetical protein
MTRYLSLFLTITLIAIAAGFAVSPVYAAPDYDEAAMGTVYNQFSEVYDAYYEGTTAVSIVQQEVTAAAATNQQTAYPWPATAAVVKVTSTDANDTGAVILTYLDENWDRLEETLTLTGQTIVSSTATPIRVLGLRCVNSGAQDTTNQGTLYVFTGTATSGVPDALSTILAIVPIAHGESKGCVFTTPRNVTKGLLRGIHYTCAEGVDFEVYCTTIDRTQTYPVKRVFGPFMLFQANGFIPINAELDDKTDVYLTAKTGTAAQKCRLGLDVYYRKQ